MFLNYFQQNIFPSIKKRIRKLQSRHYRNVSTDLVGTAHRPLWFCRAQFGNQCIRVVLYVPTDQSIGVRSADLSVQLCGPPRLINQPWKQLYIIK